MHILLVPTFLHGMYVILYACYAVATMICMCSCYCTCSQILMTCLCMEATPSPFSHLHSPAVVNVSGGVGNWPVPSSWLCKIIFRPLNH